jgi:hypothetical protein
VFSFGMPWRPCPNTVTEAGLPYLYIFTAPKPPPKKSVSEARNVDRWGKSRQLSMSWEIPREGKEAFGQMLTKNRR